MMRYHLIYNLKIRTKLLFIYCFCVLLPLFTTDIFVLYSINKNSIHEQEINLIYMMERIQYNLTKTINSSMIFTNNLYTDSVLNEFLSKKYKSQQVYYEVYNKLLTNNNLSYKYNYGVLLKVNIYTDNDTIINGGHITSINLIKDTDWYKDFKKSGEDIVLYTYYDENKKYLPGSGTSRTISIIRKLDYYGDDHIEKILKIDLDYNLMLKDVQNEQINGKIYVKNKDYLIFSNLKSDNSTKPYQAASLLASKHATMTKTFKIMNQQWEIYAITENKSFWTKILKSKGFLPLVFWNIIFPTLLIYIVSKSISKRLAIITNSLEKVKKEQFEVITYLGGEDEIGNLINSYNLMVIKIKDLIEVVFKGNAEKQALELAKKQAELKAVQSQVNPHFLFNTLETIRMRSLIKNENETSDIIGELAALLRNSMIWGSDFIKIEEEMGFVEKYIHIQKYRYGDKIQYIHYVMEECKDYKIPKLSIGTFIENAFTHGLETSVKDGVISITITKNEEFLFIEISDNGKGFSKNKLNEIKAMITRADSTIFYEVKNTGILNVFIRLKMYCDGEIEFEIESEPENGTDISIKLPLHHLYKVMDTI